MPLHTLKRTGLRWVESGNAHVDCRLTAFHLLLNTDDPGVMDINLMDECRNVMNHLGLSLETLAQCNDWAREASFIPQARIQGVWDNPSS